MANINPITGEVEEEKPTTPQVDFVYEPEVEFVYEPEPTVIDRIGAGLGRAAAAVVPDVIGTAAERAAETVVEKVGQTYDWAQEPPQFVKNIVADADKALKEAPAGSLEEKLAAVGLLSGAFVEPMTSPLGLATLGSGAAVRPVVAAARAGMVAPEVAQAVQALSGAVNVAGALPAAEAAGAALGEASVEPTAANVGTAAGNVALALLGGAGAVVDLAGATRRIVPSPMAPFQGRPFPLTPAERAAQGQMPGRGRGVAGVDEEFAQRARVVSDREWENIRNSVRSVQAVDEAQQLALPAGEQQLLLETSPRQLALEGGRQPLALPPAPAAEEFIRTVIPTGETIRVPETPTEAQVSTARELAKTKAFNEKVKRITDTFVEDGIKLNRKQAAEMARITDPREYSLTRQAILDANRPLEAGAVENPPAKTRTPLKGFEGLTPEMVGVRPEEPVAPKKTGVVAGEVPMLEGPAKVPEGLGEAPLPTTPRMLELERPMYDSGLVDAQGNTVWVDEQGRTIDRRTYEDPRERVRTPEEQAIYDKQLAERVEFDKRAEAAEQVDQMVPGESVMVSVPDAPAPVPASFVGKNPQSPSTSRVMTPQGEVAVPNTAITSAAKAGAEARLTEPVVTKVPDMVNGWDVEIGPNKYRIYRDSEDRWMLVGTGEPKVGVLSTETKADAIANLVTNESRWLNKIGREQKRVRKEREAAKARGEAASKTKPVELLPGLDTETEGVELALSSSTGMIPGLAKLHKASQTDPVAAQLLSDVAADWWRYALRDVESVKVQYIPAVGLYGNELEGSLRVRLTFSEADKGKVLSRLSTFAKNFYQEQIHMRSGAPKGSVAGTAYPDGSFNTVVMSWDAKGLKRPQIEKLAKESGLYGFTVSDDRLLAYYVGGANDAAKIKQFEQAGKKVSKSLGKNVRRIERLWIYGRGGLRYPEVRGELPVAAGERNATAQRIAARLASREVKPVPQAKELTAPQTKIQTQVSKDFGAMRMNALDTDWRVKRAYTELAEELLEQYDAVPVKVEILSGKGEPYKNSQAMRSDVLGNNHLFIFGTDAKSFGPEGIKYDNHPLLQDSGRVDVNGKPLLYNDLLRAVHDYYAHTMTPVQFGVLGEEAAWLNHMAMTRSPWARWALTSETRGQNSYVNFGPDAAWNRAHPKDTKFAPQKTDLLPVQWAKTGDPILDAEMDGIAKMRKPDYERQRAKKVYTNKERGAINVAMLNYLGQSAIGATGGFYYGYNKDPNAPLEDKVVNGLLYGIMGLGVGNPTIRNAVLNGVYKAKIPVKYFGPQIKRAVGGMDNFVIFTKSVLGEVYDVIKSEAPLAESLKNRAATALDTLESMRTKASPGDWYSVGQFLSNHGDPRNILNPKLREAAMLVRSFIDDFTIDMIGSGLVRPGSDLEFTMMLNRGTYLTRTYEIFTNPDFQYDPVKQQRAIAEYAAQLRLNGDTRPISVLQQEGLEQTLFQLARTKGTAMAPNARSFALGKGIARVDGSILQPRKELSDAWRAMMGEIDDPVRAATLTIDRMADIIAAETTQTAMAEVGLRTGLFTRQASATHSVPLVNVQNENLYGPLNKLWTTPAVADGLQTMRAYRSHSLPFRTLALITGNIKIGKTVLHPISYAPNFISALVQPFVQGHYMQMVFNPRNYRDAFSIVFDSPFPSNAAQVEADLPMLIKQGLLRQSVNMNDIVETARASGAAALGSRMVTWFPKGMEIPKKVMGGALSAYGKAEEFPRIIGFYAEAGRYAKALFGKDLNLLNPNERAVVYDRAVTVSKEVYPNSQAVPEAVKKLSVSGVLEPFVAFKYEVFRTTYESMRRGVKDVSEGVQTNNPRLVTAGMARLSALIGALYGAYAVNQAFNETRGLSGEQDEALRRRLPDWDRTGLLVVTDMNPQEVAYANQSYLLPQSVPIAAIAAALEGKTPVEAAAMFVKETAGGMVSDGGLFIKPVMEAVTGYNEFGRRIYPRDGGKYMDVSSIQSNAVRDAATGGQNLVVGAMHVLKTAAPGFLTESMKWYKAAKEEVGPDGQVYQTGDLLQRLAGIRVQRINLPLQFERHAGELFSRLNDARTEFGRARNRKDATPASIEEAYQMSEQSRKIVFRDLVQHIRDGELLKQPKEQILTNLREAGIPSDLLLGAVNGFYVAGMKEQTISARERFEAMMMLPEAKRMAMWSSIQATEPMLAKAFRPLFKEMAQARTQEERMILALDDNDGTRARLIAQMILTQPTQTAQQIKYQELFQRGMIRGQTANQLYGDPDQAAKIWAEATVMLKNGRNPTLFPQQSPDATPPTNPGATMRRPPAAPAPVPQPVAPAPAPSSKFREGQYYKDKTTGQIRQYVNGQFVPVQP